MFPAREHFGADHTAGRIAVLRLEERHELPPVERGSHLARQLLLVQQRRTQRLVVQHIAAARRTALRGAQRQERTVAHEVDVQLGIVDGIHPHANEEGEVLTIGSEPVVEHGEHAIGVEQRTREAADEMIGAQPSRRRIARQIAADHLADISEQAIARRSAEQIVIRRRRSMSPVQNAASHPGMASINARTRTLNPLRFRAGGVVLRKARMSPVGFSFLQRVFFDSKFHTGRIALLAFLVGCMTMGIQFSALRPPAPSNVPKG